MGIPVMHLVKHVPPLPTPPLSNAPLVPTKKLQPVMQGILGLPVMHLVKHVPNMVVKQQFLMIVHILGGHGSEIVLI
jgi:hypothetical protein